VATFWLTRSTRASEPVLGVTPTTRAERTAALCTVAVAPFACGVLTLLAFLHFLPASSPGAVAVIMLVLAGTGGFTHAVTT
jgi:hypothetical protein